MNYSKLLSVPVAAMSVLVSSSVALAQAIPNTTPSFSGTNSQITDLQSIMNMVLQVLKWLGWSGIFVGVTAVIALLIYKLIGSDDSDTMKKVQSGIAKAVIIVVLGLLLLSISWLMGFVMNILGFSGVTTGVPTI